jgi:hypothetical protein
MVFDTIPTLSEPLFSPQSQPAAVKFSLYVKTHEIKQLDSSLRHVLLMPVKDRQAWLEEHENFVNDLLEGFSNDSTMALDGLQLDPEALQLSIDFVTSLRDVMNTLRGILDDAQSLSS